MIAATEIGKLILNPELAGNFSAGDLSEIRDKFPYCSTLHLLYLKNISLSSALDFESHLRYSAAHVMDRERMYFLIHSKAEFVPDKIQPQESFVTNSEQENKASVISSSQEQKEDIQKPVTENSELTQSENNSSVNELIEAAPDLTSIAYSEDLVAEGSISEPEIPKLESTEEIIPVAKNKKSDGEKIALTIHSESETVSDESSADISNLSFIEWLKYKQTGKLVKSDNENKESDKGEDKIEKPDNQEVNPIEILSEKKTKKTGLSRADVDALLNKFIAEEPRISKPQATFFNPVKSAKQSLEESAELVTETLAKIYHLQKNYGKAIQAYEQLSLVYPEKKTFFASRIAKIREEQNKDK